MLCESGLSGRLQVFHWAERDSFSELVLKGTGPRVFGQLRPVGVIPDYERIDCQFWLGDVPAEGAEEFGEFEDLVSKLWLAEQYGKNWTALQRKMRAKRHWFWTPFLKCEK